MKLTRRQTLLSAAALSVVGTPALMGARPALAQATATGMARHHLMGDFRISTLLAGAMPMENIRAIYGANTTEEEFAAAAEAGFISAETSINSFTPVVVDTGAEKILFDTGLAADGLIGALAAAGYAPGDITHVVLSHMHPDHILGFAAEAGTLTFPDATFLAGRAEFDHFMGQSDQFFDSRVRPHAERFSFLEDGGAVASGVTAMAAYGHTPGHMVFMFESGGQQMLFLADAAAHYVFSLAHPDWEVMFDADKTAATAVRRNLLSMAATDRFAVAGYHMPFPAVGFVETRGDGFHYVPASYQFG